MKIADIRVNGIREPLGFSLPHLSVSWKTVETASRKPVFSRLCVAEDLDFSKILFEKEAAELRSIGEDVGLALRPRTRYHVRVEVKGDAGDAAVGESWFETGKMDEPWQAKWIGPAEGDDDHPAFFRGFSVPEGVVSARLYVTGLGLYEAYVNGEKAGDDLLAPFCNDYNAHVQAQTYDVTALMKAGENRLEIITGNGWYKGRLGYEGRSGVYGSRFQAIAELRLTLADGTERVIGTDETWQYRGSDFEATDIYDGECLNRLLWQGKENAGKPVVLMPEKTLVDRYSLPVVVKESLPVCEVIHTPAGETVLDMGQNFTGYLEYTADFPAGTRITLDHGEILQNGNFYNDNYRTAKAQMIYVADGRRETVRAHFTYFGFRYVRVTGWPGEVRPGDFTGRVVYSDLDASMRFHSSHEKLNRLAQNALWGQRSNFLDMPTDCPQRDERLGWTGDAQVFSPTACFQMDARAFYRKFLDDLRVDQLKHGGAVANYLPNFGGMPSGSSVWGDIATILPMTLYDYYGDKADLRSQYPMMKDWLEWIFRQDQQNGGQRLWNFGFHFGDWLAQDGVTPQSMKGGTDDFFVASMYYYASARKVERAARILEMGVDADRYGRLAEEIRAAILREYFSPNGRLCVDTQTAYLLCLNFGVYVDKDRLLEGLKQRFKKDCFKIKGGFVGATMMCRVLAENGLEDLAAHFLFQEGFPGWLHCVNLGATTIWERWNSVLDDGSISGTGMNSLNHYSYGSVMEYVFRDLAGIRPLEAGFTRVRFAPQPTWRLKELSCAYDSVSGEYASHWRVNDDGTLTVHFEVPFGCAAEAVLPGCDRVVELSAGAYEETYRPNVDYRLKYTMNSRLAEMKDDPEALAALKADLPGAWEMIASNDEEFMTMSLEELKTLFFRGFNPQMVAEGARRLLELKAN
ncbi:MAG: family 78 glycoside hydrolase catalytic domain [Clostridia bacterium]|nr:family 78 glycoside hydrolase catalytic domain [Clostridia bacterium]